MLLLLVACGGEDVAPAPSAEVGSALPEVRKPSARYTQEQLGHRSDALTVSGTISCDEPGPWTVRVYPFHPEGAYLQQGRLPPQGHLSEVEVAETGAFSLQTTMGNKRLVLAFQDHGEQPLIAFADAHASYVSMQGDLSEVVLDCSIAPTPGETQSIGTDGAPIQVGAQGTPDPETREWLETVKVRDPAPDPIVEERRRYLEARYGTDRTADLGPMLELLDPNNPKDLALLEELMPIEDP